MEKRDHTTTSGIETNPTGQGARLSCAARNAACAVLVFCALVVAFWEIMVARSRRGHRGYKFTARELVGFRPEVPGWTVTVLPVRYTRAEPNIAVFGLERSAVTNGLAGQVVVRLVHGYNMRDCMRLKGYTVELVADTRRPVGSELAVSGGGRVGGGSRAGVTIPVQDQPAQLPVQVWRLISQEGDVAMWVTSMLRASDFGGTDVDVRSMPFPKIQGDDRPTGLPDGLTWANLRHPIRTFRVLVRTRWNNARCDLATFLGLRTPAWASDELFTLVSASMSQPARKFDEARILGEVLDAHVAVAGVLREWREARSVSP